MKIMRAVYSALVLLASLSATGEELNDFNDFDFVKFVPSLRDTEFIIGEGNQTITASRQLQSFNMNRYETTYNLWYEVVTWGRRNGYTFQNPGQEGSVARRGARPTEAGRYMPVTAINWHDAIVWCNALSEMNGKTPCYTYNGGVIKSSRNAVACDLAECDWECDGYRLPTETEWEYAARLAPEGFYSGALASGITDSDGDTGRVAWTSDNATGTHLVGTAGTPFFEDAPPAPGSGIANYSGLFDMSGNVLEFCWDWEAPYDRSDGGAQSGARYTGPATGYERIMRGGSWNEYTPLCASGDRYSYDPNEAYNYFGFRFAETITDGAK